MGLPASTGCSASPRKGWYSAASLCLRCSSKELWWSARRRRASATSRLKTSSRQQHCQHGIEPLAAGGRGNEPLAVQCDEAAIGKPRQRGTKQLFDISPGERFETAARDALGEAEPHHHHLGQRGLRC